MITLNRRLLLGGGAAALAAPSLMTRAAFAQSADKAIDIDHAMPP